MNASSQRMSAPIDVQRVRRLFSRHEKVAGSSFLRREVANRMHERLDLIKLNPTHVLDAGCGEGADLPLLQQRFEAAQMLAVDGSSVQLAQALQAQKLAQSSMQRVLGKWLPVFAERGPQFMNADFARLPLRSKSMDLLWSNLALHWHPQPDVVLREWQRCLRENGLLMFSCFGPDTFKQMRAAFLQAGIAGGHLLPFVDMHDLGDMLVEAGFATPVMDMEMITVTYRDVVKMLADLRAFGGNPLQDRPRALLSRNAAERVWQALREQAKKSEDGQFCISFEVIYGHAFRPVATKTATGESIIQFSRNKPSA